MRTDMDQPWGRSIQTDEAGIIISVEFILVAVIVLIGLLTGLTSVRDASISELSDIAGSVQDINQGYLFAGTIGHSASNAGSEFLDARDHCDDVDDTPGQPDNCIVFSPHANGLFIGSTDTVTNYANSDGSTDISASQNATTIKWELDPGQENDADAVTQAILDCIGAGHVAEISWTDSAGGTFTFSASAVLSSGPSSFSLSGAGSASGSGKIQSATVTCPDGNGFDAD